MAMVGKKHEAHWSFVGVVGVAQDMADTMNGELLGFLMITFHVASAFLLFHPFLLEIANI